MALRHSQQDIGGAGKEGGIPFTEQHHRQTLGHRPRQLVGRVMPRIDAGLGIGHHRKQQGQAPLVAANPWRRNRGCHANGPFPRHGVGHHIGRLNRPNRCHGQEVRVARADAHQGQARCPDGGFSQRLAAAIDSF